MRLVQTPLILAISRLNSGAAMKRMVWSQLDFLSSPVKRRLMGQASALCRRGDRAAECASVAPS